MNLIKHKLKISKNWGWGKVLLELFEAHVEKDLWEPIFVKDYPFEVSPLSRRKNDDQILPTELNCSLLVGKLQTSFVN